MMNETMSFTILDEYGREVKCEALFTFESEETGKRYIVYTDHSVDKDGSTKIFASIYSQDSDGQQLLTIKTKKEWKMIETILEKLQADIREDFYSAP